MTLRRRLTVGVCIAVGVSSAVFALLSYRIVGDALNHDVDQSLRMQAARLAMENGVGGDRPGMPMRMLMDPRGPMGPGHDFGPFGRGAVIAQILDRSGVVITQTDGARQVGGLPRGKGSVPGGSGRFRTVRISGTLYRMFERARDARLVQVARPLSDVDRFLERLRVLLAMVVLAAIGVSALFSRWIARVVLRPVSRMTGDARAIQQTGDLSRRVQPPYADAEFRDFARSLDDLLDSIERSELLQREFVADASHELRTPLTSLRGNTQFLASGAGAPEDVDSAIAAINRDVERLVAIAGSLTTLARLDVRPAASRESVDVDDIVSREVGRAREQYPDRTITVKSTAGIHELDSDLVTSIVSNLVDNACRYTGEGAAIEVAATIDHEYPGTVTITVDDDGPGVADDQIEHLFTRFHRGEQTADIAGSGLGLAIVRRAAEMLGGTATASRSVHGGLRVTVTLSGH